MKRLFLCVVALLVAATSQATVMTWTNTAGGNWQNAANWSPNIIPGSSDTALITTPGNYSVQLLTNTITVGAVTIGGAGAPTLLIDSYGELSSTNCVVAAGGVLLLSNAWEYGAVTIQSGGQMFFSGAVNAYIYNLIITNQGTVTWNSGSISIGGNQIYNSGLWLITTNTPANYGGGGESIWHNSGILRKMSSTGISSLNLVDFQNQPGGLVDVQTGTLNISGGTNNPIAGTFTNSVSGTINITAGTWTDAGGAFVGLGTNLFNGGTMNLRTNVPAGLKFVGGDVYVTGTNSFQQAGAITNLSIDGATLRGTNTVGAGTLTFTWGSIPDKLTILPAGQLLMTGTQNKLLYGLTLINQGTVTSSGNASIGNTVISNGGLWQFTGDYNLSYGGLAVPVWTNSGTLRKASGSGISAIDSTFVNQPGALVEALTGRLIFTTGTASQYGGTFNAAGIIDLNGGTWTDAGGVATGAGTNRFLNGTLNLRTNNVPGLLLTGGNIYITGTNTFQNAGAITNLTLDGASLPGTNSVSGGTLAVNSGSITGQLTVQPNGSLIFTTVNGKSIGGLTLLNRGNVTLDSGNVTIATTIISNGGLWQITGDYGLNNGGVGSPTFTNYGTFVKTSGTGFGVNTGFPFYNQPGGLVQVDAGTLQLSASSTNTAGTLRLNGGTLSANGTFPVSGGTLMGSGNFGASAFTGGVISPGNGGAGLMAFTAGLNLNSNVTLMIDGTGPSPGTTYDQLSVTGAVIIANCNLQITSMPSVPAGTTFTIIANDGSDAINGTFNGLPENSPITVGAQTFRIHYAGGTGNDVTLVRDGPVIGPTLMSGGLTNGSWLLNGSNAIPLIGYTIRATTNFLTWTNIGVATSSVSGTLNFVDTNAFRYKYRFYNVTN